MSREDDTIYSESPLGQRLSKMKRSAGSQLLYNGKIFPIVSEISIGRSKENDIVIEDGMTSRKHAIIQKIKEDFFLKDLGSSNGTYVNEERVPEHKYMRLHKKDKITIGRTFFTII